MAKLDHYEHVSRSTPDEGPGPDMPGKDGDHAETESLRRWKTSMRKRIGTYGLVVVIGGIPFQLGIMAFLGYLWSQQARGESETGQTVWRTIVLHAWMAPTITLCSVVLRSIVGVQLVVCTALLAGLMLETGASRFEDAARLSILRAYNSGPLDIVLLAVQRLPKIRLSMPELIAAALFIVGTALQFASTLLVSDLGDAVIPSDPESRRVPVVDRSGLFVQANGHYMWTKHPGVWPTFAEARADDGVVGADLVDTGTIRRALLPFESADRLLLRSYEGLSVMQEARTVCVPVDLGDTRITLYQGTDQLALQGTLSASLKPFYDAGFVFPGRSFNESVDNRTELDRVPFGCPFWGNNQNIAPLGVQEVDLVVAFCFIGDYGFERFVIIHLDGGNFTTWYPLAGSRFERKATKNGWANYLPVHPTEPTPSGHSFAASLCGFKQNHTIQTISASTTMAPTEHALEYDAAASEWSALPILSLLGVVNDTTGPDARGLLRLHSHTLSHELEEVPYVTLPDFRRPDRTSKAINTVFRKGIADAPPDTGATRTTNASLVFCTTCSNFFGNDTVHPAHIILMRAALRATNNPAAALDALWATWTQQLYSNAIGQFDAAGKDNSTVVWATTVQAPRRWVGFVVALALVVANAVGTVAVVVLFVVKTSYSVRGGLWQAIAQVAVGEMREVLEGVTRLPDGKVADLIRDRGLDGVELGTKVDGVTGEVRLVRRDRTWREEA